MRRSVWTPCAIALAVLLLAALLPATAQERVRPPAHPGGSRPTARPPAPVPAKPPKPVRTDAGAWDGTWYYVARDVKAAIWIRTVDARPEVRMQYRHTGTLEGFQTDWSGLAEYHDQGYPGRFESTVVEGDEDLIRWTWDWTLDRRSKRHETADIEIYRTGEGRALVLDFVDSQRRIVETDGDAIELPPRWFWTFRKAASGQALWEELPF